MISQIVDPPEQLRDVAQELAETVARNSPAAMAATKRALWGALELGLTDACRNGARELVSMWGHPDQEEGPLALRREACSGVGAARARVVSANLADNLPGPEVPRDAGLLHTIERTLTVDEAWHGVTKIAASLLEIGVEPRQAVAVQLPNGPEFILAMFGVWLRGAVFVPVNWRATAPEVRAHRRDDRRGRARGRRRPARASTQATSTLVARTTRTTRSSRGPRAPPVARSRSCTPTPGTPSCSTASSGR